MYHIDGVSRVQGPQAHQHYATEVRARSLCLSSSSTKKGAQHLVDLFVHCRQHTSYLVTLLWPNYWVTHKNDSFEWGLEQNEALYQDQSVVQSMTELFDATGPVVLETTRANSDTIWSLWWALKGAWLPGFVMRASSVTIIPYLKSSYWTPVET